MRNKSLQERGVSRVFKWKWKGGREGWGLDTLRNDVGFYPCTGLVPWLELRDHTPKIGRVRHGP